MPPRTTLVSQAVVQDVDRTTLAQAHRNRPDSPTPSNQRDRDPSTPTNRTAHDKEQDQDESDNESNPFSKQSSPNLAEALMLITHELRRREATPRATSSKVKEPDTFDGSEPKKLSNFILLCKLYFRNNPAYTDDSSKVTFALTHLRGTALDYFEPLLSAEDPAPWEEDWPEFVRMLRTQFGPIDPTADAEDNIDNLKMKDNQRILKYNVEFNRLAVQTGWDDSVLRHHYYSGLAERIKDVMGQVGKPSTLEEMRTVAHSIDARHWEHAREKSRSNPDKANTNTSSNKSDKKPSSGNNSGSNNKSSNNQSKDSSSSSNNNGNKNEKPKSSANPLTDKLGKDGKLTPQERQRRFDNNLCMFCGGMGHTANACPKSTSAASKAKAGSAQADSNKDSDESKK